MRLKTVTPTAVPAAMLPLGECPTRYPSIQTLQAFEAVARLHSFTRAAEELFLTQSAVTHQIRALEQYLNTRLFRRNPRGVELSEAGLAIYHDITGGLAMIGRCLNGVRRQSG